MKIHRVKAGEDTGSISSLYGISEESLKAYNNLSDDRVLEGDELLILIPTRTYTPRPKDCTEGISARFGIPTSSLMQNNPGLSERKLPTTLALKYPTSPYGAAAANGYFYKGCSTARLQEVIPYLTYVTFASASLTDKGIHKIFDCDEAARICKDRGAVPLIKFFDKRDITKDGHKSIEDMIKFASRGGFSGISLDLSDFPADKGTAEYLLELRRAMIGCDMILITEIAGRSYFPLVDYSDGCTLLTKPGLSARELRGELSEFSDESESIKTLVELPVFAECNEEFIGINEALALARGSDVRIETDKNTLISSFEHKRKGRIRYPSLSYIKALLDCVNEYGFMGISFDIMRVPEVYLQMFGSLFKVHKSYSSVR